MIDHPNVHHLAFQGKDITLVGTAHISRESADLVSQVIEETKPDTVCVELCQSRYDSLTQKKKWENTDLLKVIKEKKAFLLLSNLLLASFQRKIGQKLGIRPGEEILQAIRSAEAAGSAWVSKAPVARRSWQALWPRSSASTAAAMSRATM